MRIITSGETVTLAPETAEEHAGLDVVRASLHGRDLQVLSVDRHGMVLGCAAPPVPIDITFDTTPMPLQLISNLAETPFDLDGRRYASIEGYWQGLKFPHAADRERIAALSGHAAKKAGPASEPGDHITYEGRTICVGTIDHWALMERACTAKFTQHEGARSALVSTLGRPLEHKVHPDSRTIPGLVMADIWTRLRATLQP